MIHVVNQTNRSEYSAHMRELWQQRYKVFVEKMGWSLDCPQGIERDRYDRSDTIYLMSIDDQGKLKGAMRLLPTTKAHLMNELFPTLCASGVPSGEKIWEISRFYSLTGRHMMLERDRTVSELVCGLLEYCLGEGIDELTCVASMVLFPTILKAGWDVVPLGLPEVVDGEVILAFKIVVDEATYDKVCENRSITGSVMYRPHQAEVLPLEAAL